MKTNKILRNIIAGLFVMSSVVAFAGNPDRTGQSAAGQLLINPWGRTAGWGGVGIAMTTGIEANFSNIAGTAFVKGTELEYTNTRWLVGSDATINAFGVSQNLGNIGVLTLSLATMSVGDILITTYEQPEGGVGYFKPSMMNINLGYAKSFSDAIHAGVNFKLISESIADISATGFAIDAGIQYVSGDDDQIHFGVTLKNIGLPMHFSGDGFSVRGVVDNSTVSQSLETRAAEYELPSLLAIGIGYDFYFGGESTNSFVKKTDKRKDNAMHRITAAASFTSNAFTKDQDTIGAEYGFNQIFEVRGAYAFESDIFDDDARTNVLTGASFGASLYVPLGKQTSRQVAIDYSYRFTDPFDGCHSFGVRIGL